MKRISVFIIAVVFLVSTGIALLQPKTALASWNPNNVIVDPVFDNAGTMNIGDIQNFLNQFPNSCLKNYQSPFPNGYNSYGGNVSAATVIRRAADIYGVNPEVILATLQKESSVVTSDCTYINTAMGMGCPDSGACPAPGFGGFSQQVTKGTWLLKFGKERANGNVNWTANDGAGDDPSLNYSGPMTQGCKQRKNDAPVVCYDGYTTIDGQSVHVDTGATASFYNYTPHSHGNQLFVSIFESWFGSTQTTTPYAWNLVSSETFSDSGMTQPFTDAPTVAPNGKLYVRIRATNTGNQTWDQSFMRVGTWLPMDRTSVFHDVSWPLSSRPGQMVESSVPPGATGTFQFTLSAPSTAGSYTEHFNLVADGHAWLNDIGLSYTINVVSPVVDSNVYNTGLASGAVMHPNDYLLSPDGQSVLTLQTDGHLVLYSDFRPVWVAGTYGKTPVQAIMQSDGNFVIYYNDNSNWSSSTFGSTGATLKMLDTGNVVINNTGNATIWSTSTVHNPSPLSYVNTTMGSSTLFARQSLETADRRYHLDLQTDGNLVLYSSNRPLWSSGTYGSSAKYLSMQGDGNLVIYDNNNHAIWNSSTWGKGPSKLTIQQDGNLVVYGGDGHPTWSSGTFNQF